MKFIDRYPAKHRRFENCFSLPIPLLPNGIATIDRMNYVDREPVDRVRVTYVAQRWASNVVVNGFFDQPDALIFSHSFCPQLFTSATRSAFGIVCHLLTRVMAIS